MDIVERLVFLPLVHSLPVGVADVTSDAATEITRLRAELTQAMKERSRAISVGDDLEQEVERLRAWISRTKVK